MDSSQNLKKRTKRTEKINISFGANGLAENFHFSLTEAFSSALDIFLTPRVTTDKIIKNGVPINNKKSVSIKTQGKPPLYNFSAGEIFYAPAQAKIMIWEKAITILQNSIQILDAKPDTYNDNKINGNTVNSGYVKFRLNTYKNTIVINEKKAILSQKDFVEFLRTGNLKTSKNIKNKSFIGRINELFNSRLPYKLNYFYNSKL